MFRILAIAHNTFKETIRDRILYNILIFAVILIGFSYVLHTLTILQDEKIIIDLSLACISMFGLLIAIFIGVGLVYKEIEKRTIYTILSKPVSRSAFLFGKYLGLLGTLFVNVTVMTIVMYIMLVSAGKGADSSILKAILLIYVELMLITAIALFFSSFTTPTLSAIFTLSFFVIGYVTDDLKILGERSGIPEIKGVTSLIYYILPNLNCFNIKGEIVHRIPVSSEQIILALIYGFIYITIFFLLSIAIFYRRDFK